MNSEYELMRALVDDEDQPWDRIRIPPKRTYTIKVNKIHRSKGKPIIYPDLVSKLET